MKYTKISLGIAITLLLLGATSMSVFGFLFGSARTEKWKEEVQFSDGRFIVVEREILRERGGDEWAHNRSGTKPKEYRIRFDHPDWVGNIIRWSSTKKSPSTWPEVPLILDFESGQPVIFTIVAISDVYEVYSKYVYRNGKWFEESLPDTLETRTTNLFLKLGIDMPKYVDMGIKRKVNADTRYRRSLKQVGPRRQVLMN